MTRTLAVAAYALFGSLLAWSRLSGLGTGGYCCDEIRTVADSVRAGPETIFTGVYTPNNHMLYSLLGWATSAVVGESEVVLRMGAAIPFIVGVVVVTAWLDIRVDALAAVFYLALATFSPLLLDLSRLARGYGLAFLAMSVMIVAALEAVRSGRGWTVAAFWAAGVVGAWTLPHFAIPFGAVGIALLLRPELRGRCLIGGALSVAAIALWYGPRFDDIRAASSQDYGKPIDAAWLLTAPSDQVLFPAFVSLDETVVNPSFVTLAVAVALAVVLGSSPLLHRGASAAILGAAIASTLLAFWISGTGVVPRFLSFLLVPLLVLMATGCAAVLRRWRKRSTLVQTGIVLVVVAVVVTMTTPFLASVPRERRDSLREAAAVIREQAPSSAPVYAFMPYSTDLAFHLGRSVHQLSRSADPAVVCHSGRTSVYVAQPWFWPAAPIPGCVTRRGTRQHRFEHYARGGELDLWIIPAADA